MLAAPRRSGIIVGYALGALVRWLITAVIVTLVAILAGMQVKGTGIDLAGLYMLAVIVNVAFLLWACGVAMRFQSVQAGADHADAGLPDPLLRAGVRPARAAQGWIHGVATANPVTRVLEAVRSLLAGQPADVGIGFAVGFGLILLFALWAIRGLQRAEASG